MLKQNEKEEVKVVEVPEIKPQEEIILPKETPTEVKSFDNNQGIEVSDIEIPKVKEYPLIVKLPADASLAQIAYAKIMNVYAYQNPKKFAGKKDAMVKTLLSLKNAPDPVANGHVKINNVGI